MEFQTIAHETASIYCKIIIIFKIIIILLFFRAFFAIIYRPCRVICTTLFVFLFITFFYSPQLFSSPCSRKPLHQQITWA